MEKSSTNPREFFVHPQVLIVYLIIGGVSALFFGFSFAYMYTRVENELEPVRLPILFFVSAAILFLTSITFNRASSHFEEEDGTKYLRQLKYSLFLTIAFFVMQLVGWYDLFSRGLDIQHGPLTSYLYVISGVHIGHVLLGLPFLVIFLVRSRKKLDRDLAEMLYFSDPVPKRHLRLLKIYWLFLDRLWIFLLLFFWLNWFFAEASLF